jgi:hypothetical protein
MVVNSSIHFLWVRPGYTYTFQDNPIVWLTSFPNPAQVQGFSISPIEFDEDRDDQMRVAAAVSNLRARNYAIPEVLQRSLLARHTCLSCFVGATLLFVAFRHS